jgi:hypothetical protein
MGNISSTLYVFMANGCGALGHGFSFWEKAVLALVAFWTAGMVAGHDKNQTVDSVDGM